MTKNDKYLTSSKEQSKGWYTAERMAQLQDTVASANLPKFRLFEDYPVVNSTGYSMHGVTPKLFGVICPETVVLSSVWLSKVVGDLESAAYWNIVHNYDTRYEYNDGAFPHVTEGVSMPEFDPRPDDAPKNGIKNIIKWIGLEVLPLVPAFELPTYAIRVVLNAEYKYLSF